MTTKEMQTIKKLANEATRAARIVQKNRFMIETLLSLEEAKTGKTTAYKSVSDMFKKLGIKK